TRKQMVSSMKEVGVTKDEIMDVLKVVLLTSGMPAFNRAVKVLKGIEEEKIVGDLVD
ncbi:carboxymuconolactone decarboxylase family protein, partial [Methanobrevibacter woesei]